MTDIIIISLVGAAATVMGGLIVFFSNRQLNKSNALSVNADTITKLSNRIDQLVIRDEEREKQIDNLEKKLKNLLRAYEMSLKHIRKIDPVGEIPDFLEWDTGRLARYYRDNYGD